MSCSTVKNDVFISSDCQPTFFQFAHVRVPSSFSLSLSLLLCSRLASPRLAVEHSPSREKKKLKVEPFRIAVERKERIRFHMRERKSKMMIITENTHRKSEREREKQRGNSEKSQFFSYVEEESEVFLTASSEDIVQLRLHDSPWNTSVNQ